MYPIFYLTISSCRDNSTISSSIMNGQQKAISEPCQTLEKLLFLMHHPQSFSLWQALLLPSANAVLQIFFLVASFMPVTWIFSLYFFFRFSFHSFDYSVGIFYLRWFRDKTSRKDEIIVLHRNETWELLPLPLSKFMVDDCVCFLSRYHLNAHSGLLNARFVGKWYT